MQDGRRRINWLFIPVAIATALISYALGSRAGEEPEAAVEAAPVVEAVPQPPMTPIAMEKFQIGAGYSIRPDQGPQPSLLNIVPNGAPKTTFNALAAIKLFETDYVADRNNYADFGIWISPTENVFNSKSLGEKNGGLKPFVFKVQDTVPVFKIGINGDRMLYGRDLRTALDAPAGDYRPNWALKSSKSVYRLRHNNEVVVTAKPSIEPGVEIGQMLTVISAGKGNLTLQGASALPGSALGLKSGDRLVIRPHTAHDFVWDGQFWCER